MSISFRLIIYLSIFGFGMRLEILDFVFYYFSYLQIERRFFKMIDKVEETSYREQQSDINSWQ